MTESRVQQRMRSERGEGVISTAIAVLVMALLGLAMWTAFSQMFGDATSKTENRVAEIGN